MNSTEIAAQLREIADVYSVGSTNVIAIRKAADMISLMDGHVEDIMMRNQQLVLENEALRQQVEAIKNGFEGSCYACEPVGEMNKKLQRERDEARREICVLQVLYSRFYHVGEESECAKDREWDCYKEETP